MASLDIQSLGVSYDGSRGSVRALADFSLQVRDGRLTILLGESGCGKSTALNAIAGLVTPDAGSVRLGDSTLFNARNVNAPPNHRDIGMVFQSYALWPHLTALENVAYPLRRRGRHADAESESLKALAMVRCDSLAHRYPGELSGGQQQRVALARALVAKPRLLLFDEPLSNLDAGLRRNLRDELARLHKQIGFTGVYVTHDQSEALALGTDVAVMDAGRIVQSGSPTEIYERPATEFVARFFGANVTPGRIVERRGGGARIETAMGMLDCDRAPSSDQVVVAFMPHDLVMEPATESPLELAMVTYLGSHREMRLVADGHDILAVRSAATPTLQPGTRVRAHVAPDKVHVFPRQDRSPAYSAATEPVAA